jgi:site-specific DNA-methyltransferase (adenine-specific)
MAWLYSSGMPKSQNVGRALNQQASTPAEHEDAHSWSGWGTTLKPAFEPIVLARRPLTSTMVDNIRKWGVGPLNLNPHQHMDDPSERQTAKWPTNVAMDADQANALRVTTAQNPADYFWVAKPNKAERIIVDGVSHPIVKPLDLVRRLTARVTPGDGLVLDPFAGSGTTVEACVLDGFRVIAIEREAAYLPLIEARVRRAQLANPTRAVVEASDTLPLF